MKRILGLVVALVMLVSIGTVGAAEDTKVTLEYWFALSGSLGEMVENLIANYNASQSDVEVIATYQGTYHETVGKVQQAIAAGTAPDVFMLERALVAYLADAGVLLDMQSYVDAAGMSDFFNPGLMGHSYFEGELISLPFNRSTPILHVNKTMLDELGLAVPDTWADLEAVANALIIKDGDETARYGVTMPYDTWYPIAMTTQAGGMLINEDQTDLGCIENGELVKALSFIKGLENDGALIYPPPGYGGDYCNQLFIEGKVGILFNSTGAIGGLKDLVDFEYVTAFLPQDVKRATPTGGANVAILTTTKHPDEAWGFIEWAMKDQEHGVLPFIVQSGYVPFADAFIESDAIQDLWAEFPMYRTAYEQLQYAIDTNKTIHWPELNVEMLTMIEAIMYDDADIPSAVEAFRDEAVRILSQ